MSVIDRLRLVLTATGALGSQVDAATAELVAAYNEPARSYHNLEHIDALLRLADFDEGCFTDRPSVQLAILYHDAVYDPRRSDNEVQSAVMATDRLQGLGVPADVVRRVAHLIDMTRHGAVEPNASDTDLARFLDFDLSILGAEPGAYDAYASAIRSEYRHVVDADYRKGRASVLSMFLELPAIFRSADLTRRWEVKARRNLTRELEQLAACPPS